MALMSPEKIAQELASGRVLMDEPTLSSEGRGQNTVESNSW